MLVDTIKDEIKKAMKAKDSDRLTTLRSLHSDVKNAGISAGDRDEIGDNVVLDVIQKAIKQRQDAAEQYVKAGRDELAENEVREIEVLKAFLPEPLSADELKSLIKDTVDELGKDMGAVMKAMKEKVSGRADGKTLSQMVKDALKD